MPTTVPKIRAAVLATATASVALITAPAASATASAPTTAAACTSVQANTTSPARGKTKTYPVTTVGTVTLKRTGVRLLRVVSTAPAPGYAAVVKIPSGHRIQVAFRATGSTLHVYFGAAPGHTRPSRLHTVITTCQ
jgi:hypothetical protein